MAGPVDPWKLSDGAGKIPSAHSAVEAAEAEEEASEAAEAEEADEAAETVESELVDGAKRCGDAMAHRVRTRPWVAMALDALGPLGPSFATKRTRRAHALLSTLGGVSGPRRIAERASKPAPCVPLERPPERHTESAESRPIVSSASVHIERETKKREKRGYFASFVSLFTRATPVFHLDSQKMAQKKVFSLSLFCCFVLFCIFQELTPRGALLLYTNAPNLFDWRLVRANKPPIRPAPSTLTSAFATNAYVLPPID